MNLRGRRRFQCTSVEATIMKLLSYYACLFALLSLAHGIKLSVRMDVECVIEDVSMSDSLVTVSLVSVGPDHYKSLFNLKVSL